LRKGQVLTRMTNLKAKQTIAENFAVAVLELHDIEPLNTDELVKLLEGYRGIMPSKEFKLANWYALERFCKALEADFAIQDPIHRKKMGAALKALQNALKKLPLRMKAIPQ
jgi:hypothetical protein